MYLRTYLITGAADRRPKMKQKISRPAPEGFSHPRHALLKDPRGDSPPPSVQQTHSRPRRIQEEDRDTIGHCHTHQNPCHGRKVAIGIGAPDQPDPPLFPRPKGHSAVDPGLPLVHQNLPPMNLTGLHDHAEPQARTEDLPRFPFPSAADIPSEREVPVPLGGPLCQPGKARVPIRVDPEPRVSGFEDLLHSMLVNIGICRAYHGIELPDIRRIDPRNLSFPPKFRSFEVQSPRGSPGHR